MKNLKADKIFLVFIIAGTLFLILGLAFYFLYIKPKQEKKREKLELEKQKELKGQQKELDERIKKNQQYWKQIADYMNFIEKENNKD